MSTSTAAPAREPANALERVSGLLSLLRFAFPTMVMMVFNGLYTIVDVIFVARFVNTEALSAINIINPAMGVLWGLGTMLGTGGSALIARKMGGGDTAGARRNFSLLILAGALLGLFFSGLGLLFLEPIIRALGASDILAPYCREYFGTLLLFTPAGLVLALFAFFFVAAGKPALNMALIIASGLTNTLLDYVFIVLLGMGVAGAALATGIAFLIPPLGGLCFFLYSKGPLHFTRPGMRLREFGQACFNGSSEMIAQLSISVTTYLFNITMLRLAGEAGVAALTITAYSEYFLVTLFLGFSMGVAPVISYNYGSGNHARQRRIFRSCLLFICVGSILVFSAALLGASRLIGIFAPPDSRVFALADQGFHIFVFNFLFCGYGIFASSLFTALSNGKVSAIIAFLRTFALIALFLLVLPEFLGLTGVWPSPRWWRPFSSGAGAAPISIYRKNGKGQDKNPSRDSQAGRPRSRRRAARLESQTMSWLAATTVVPARAAARTAVSMALALAASTLEVGSSSSRTSGRRTSRAARATRCFSPPESAFQERRSMSCSGVKPTASMASSAACRRSWRRPRTRRP